jgi:hypothetical protein
MNTCPTTTNATTSTAMIRHPMRKARRKVIKISQDIYTMDLLAPLALPVS